MYNFDQRSLGDPAKILVGIAHSGGGVDAWEGNSMSDHRRSFSTAFVLAEAVEKAISDAVNEAPTIRPDLVALKIIQEHPEFDLGAAEFTAAVIESAARSRLAHQAMLPVE